jgi:hypothetical protein
MTDPNNNPLVLEAVESITKGMAQAFDQVWSRPDAPRLVELFLSDRLVFQIDRQGVTIAERPDDEPPEQSPPTAGGYL